MKIFFENLPTIKLKEPLIDFFGTPMSEVVEFNFQDVIKVAGHACPTVLGAYLQTYYSLRTLYGDDLPIRGEIEISFRESEDSGTTGVVGNVIGLITGSAGIGGFKGLGGKFSRNNKTQYSADQKHKLIFKRTDNNKSVAVDYNPESIAFSKNISPYLEKSLLNTATPEEKKEMNHLWNERLQNIINASNVSNEIIKVTKLNY
jgi:formylmethanofuran dehydrogenase subunit E